MLQKEFHTDDRGPLKWFLGIDFSQSEDGIYTMSQQQYCKAILNRFKMTDCKPASTPAEKNLTLQPRNEEGEPPDIIYRQAVGSLVNLATATRPDLSWIVSKLSQHLDKPSQAHVAAIERVFRIIKGSTSFCIKFTPTDGQLIAYTDSDWGNDIENCRSTLGFVTTLESAPISWKSISQLSHYLHVKLNTLLLQKLRRRLYTFEIYGNQATKTNSTFL